MTDKTEMVLVSRDELQQLIGASVRCAFEEYRQEQAPQDTSEYYTIRQLAEKWGIGRKAVSRLLEDFSERGLIRVDSNPVTSIIDMVCVKSWMIAGRLIENPTYRQTIKAYEGVRVFLFNGQQLETLRRSSARKKKEKPTEETSEGTDSLPSMNPTHSNPIIEGTGTAETETAATTESEVKGSAENAVVDAADNTPFLEEDSTLSGSRE